ncbi:MAG: major capsid protein [Lachnospiraceae bacterium]
MAINIYQTQTMIAAMQLIPKRPTFLRDRYFETSNEDMFVTEDVLIEYKDEKLRKMAPFVMPKKGGIAVPRDGYRTERLTPPYIAPERTLTVDDLKKKQFGETLFSQQSPAAREGQILKNDLIDLNGMIDTSEECMSSQTLFNNGYSFRQYADKYGSSEYEEYEIHFYDGDQNTAVYVPSAPWSRKNDVIISDLHVIAKMLKNRGLRASDVIFGDDVADVLINNEYIQKLLDNRRLNLADINPQQLPDGATSYGKINCMGIMLELICYSEEYVDIDDGKTKSFVPQGKITVTAPKMGRCMYGAITQMEESDKQYYTYVNKRVPHITYNTHDSVRTLAQKARPMIVPKYKDSAISATVLY